MNEEKFKFFFSTPPPSSQDESAPSILFFFVSLQLLDKNSIIITTLQLKLLSVSPLPNPHIRQHINDSLLIPIVDFLILQPGLAEPYSRFSQFQIAFHLILVSSYLPTGIWITLET